MGLLITLRAPRGARFEWQVVLVLCSARRHLCVRGSAQGIRNDWKTKAQASDRSECAHRSTLLHAHTA
eukprot:3960796-Prymnesium_polylepis.1